MIGKPAILFFRKCIQNLQVFQKLKTKLIKDRFKREDEVWGY